MIEAFFSTLIAIVGISTAIYSYFYDKKNLLWLTMMMVMASFCVFFWELGIIFVAFFFLYKRVTFGSFIAINMFGAIVLAWFFLNLFMLYELPYLLISTITVILICALAVFGIFEDELKKYLLISSAIQITFVALDLAVGKMTGHLDIISTVQIFNYTFAGLTLFLTIGVFAKDKKFISELEGSYFTDRFDDIFATIACLSLAGLPAFNMFVSEWALFTVSFTVSPMITILGIFAALLLFVMYYKIVYVLLVGEGKPKYAPKPVTLVNGLLAACCVIFGLFPQIQWFILGKVGV